MCQVFSLKVWEPGLKGLGFQGLKFGFEDLRLRV